MEDGGKMTAPRWSTWDQGTRKASAEGKVLLLFLVAPWCRFCREMEETTFSDPEVLGLIEESFVPVKVNADRRPDLDSRYNMGGWPTVAFLSPEGDLISGDTFLGPGSMRELLPKVLAFWKGHRDEIETEPVGRGELPHEIPPTFDQHIIEDIQARMLEKFDHRWGGWGEGQKFPHTESIDFAMIQYAKTGDHRMRDVVVKTLDNMMQGGIHDLVDGGFFRFSKTRDWRVPNFEKVLDSNAQRLRCYLEAWQLFGEPGYRKAAESILRWMCGIMYDEESGAFYGSCGDDPEYYALDAEARRDRGSLSIDKTIYTNWNAMAVTALLKASTVLDRPDLLERATRTLDFLLRNLYFEEEGMYHYWDGTYHLPGLLTDQAYMIQALLTASQFTGDADLLLPAERIAEVLIETHRAPEGGFFDLGRQHDTRGALKKRNRSILENAVLAEALVRLAYLSKRDEFRDVARETLEAFTAQYKQYGYFVTGYARAIDLFLYEPLVVTVVGRRTSPDAKALRLAAQHGYIPTRIVQTLDPELDPILMKRSGYEPTGKARAYLSLGKTTLGLFDDPEALSRRMKEVEQERHLEKGSE